MNTRQTNNRLAAFAAALVVTLSLLSGVGVLTDVAGPAAQLAHAAPVAATPA